MAREQNATFTCSRVFLLDVFSLIAYRKECYNFLWHQAHYLKRGIQSA